MATKEGTTVAIQAVRPTAEGQTDEQRRYLAEVLDGERVVITLKTGRGEEHKKLILRCRGA